MNCIALSLFLEPAEIRKLVSLALNTDESRVFVASCDEELLNYPVNSLINVVFTKVPGEFPLWLDICSESNTNDLDIAKSAQKYTDSPVLISDDSNDPFTWLYWSGNQLLKVSIDPIFNDETDGFKIEDVLGAA